MAFRKTMALGRRIASLHGTGCADRPGETCADPIRYAKAYLRSRGLFGFDTGPLFGHVWGGNAGSGSQLAYPGKRSKARSPMIIEHAVSRTERKEMCPVLMKKVKKN